MKRTLALVLLALSTGVYAQLYVSPTTTDGSYVYVNDTFIYVENDVNLVTNSTAISTTTNRFPNIILRNQAQLLQGNGVSQDNDGSGDLSVYQEGTHFSTEYNFWHSPVGIAQDTESGSLATLASGNTHFAFRPSGQNLFVPVTQGRSNEALIMPTNAFDGATSNGGNLSIASFWLFKFDGMGGNATANFIPVQDSGIAEVGYGFTMKGVNGTDNTTVNGIQNNPGGNQRYDFRGRPNNGTITVPIIPNSSVLTGNPYPSAFDLSYFLLENSISGNMNFPDGNGDIVSINGRNTLDGTAYFWDQGAVGSHFIEEYQGGYGTFTPVDLASSGMYVPATFTMFDENGDVTGGSVGNGANVQRRFSPIGQGFFVRSTTTPSNSDFVIRNDHRAFVREGATTFSQFRNSEGVTNNSSNQNAWSIWESQSDTTAQNDSNENDIIGVGISYNTSDFNPISHLRINTEIDNTYTRQLAVGFHENASENLDIAMDGQTLSVLSADVSFVIENEADYVINMIASHKGNKLPLKVTAGFQTSVIFYVESFHDFDHDEVYILDSTTGIYHDIVNNKAEFILPEGVYEDRFFVVFEKDGKYDDKKDLNNVYVSSASIKNANVKRQIEVFNSIQVKQNNVSKTLEILNPQQADITGVELFDVSGKLIFTNGQMGNNPSYTFPTQNLSTGVYILRIQTQSGLTKSRKLSINN